MMPTGYRYPRTSYKNPELLLFVNTSGDIISHVRHLSFCMS